MDLQNLYNGKIEELENRVAALEAAQTPKKTTAKKKSAETA